MEFLEQDWWQKDMTRQIAGIDFQDNFVPVTSKVTFRMLLILMMTKGYYAETLDVETAFLHGKLEEEILY